MGFEDELAKWEAEKNGKASSPRKAESAPADEFPDLSHLLGGDGQNESEPAPTPAPPVATTPAPAPSTRPIRDDYKIDIATSPADARRIAAEKAKSQNDTTAFGYGVARGATLGGIDRLVGLGTAIGERLGASDAIPARPGAYQEGRREYLQGEDKSRKISPWHHMGGEIVGGAAAAPFAPAGTAGRLALAGGLGATAGALNTRDDDAAKMAKNAAIGAGAGVVTEGTLGTAARKIIRNAPKREMDTTVRDVMESEAGRATATTGKKLARDIDDIRDVLKNNPDARKAVRKEAKEALPVITAKADAAYAGQPARYAVVDQTVKPMTVTQLLGKLVAAEKDVPENRLPLVKKGLKALRDSLRDDFAPKWSGQASWSGQKQEITTEQLRKWVSSVQGTAEAAMGGINGTNAAKVPADIAKIANQILEERLDAAAAKGGAGVAKTVAEIRESDRQVSAWLGIKRALEDRNVRELAQNAGLNTRLGHANSQNANAMGLAIAAEGHPVAGATVAAKGAISRVASKVGRYVNDSVLSPVQELAERGAAIQRLRDAAMDPKASLAFIARMAQEQGISQSIARTIFEETRARKPLPAPPAAPMPAPDLVPMGRTEVANAPVYPREYATSTRTQ